MSDDFEDARVVGCFQGLVYLVDRLLATRARPVPGRGSSHFGGLGLGLFARTSQPNLARAPLTSSCPRQNSPSCKLHSCTDTETRQVAGGYKTNWRGGTAECARGGHPPAAPDPRTTQQSGDKRENEKHGANTRSGRVVGSAETDGDDDARGVSTGLQTRQVEAGSASARAGASGEWLPGRGDLPKP